MLPFCFPSLLKKTTTLLVWNFFLISRADNKMLQTPQHCSKTSQKFDTPFSKELEKDTHTFSQKYGRPSGMDILIQVLNRQFYFSLEQTILHGERLPKLPQSPVYCFNCYRNLKPPLTARPVPYILNLYKDVHFIHNFNQ